MFYKSAALKIARTAIAETQIQNGNIPLASGVAKVALALAALDHQAESQGVKTASAQDFQSDLNDICGNVFGPEDGVKIASALYQYTAEKKK